MENGEVLVTWRQFAKENPGVMQWILQYCTDYMRLNTVRNVTLDNNVHNYTLNGETPLYIRVLGSRTTEWLPQNLTLVPWTSTELAVTDLDEGEVIPNPHELQLVEVQEESFTMSWLCENAQRYTFLVCVRRMDRSEECLESLGTNTTVHNLDAGSEYEVRVQARVPGRALGGAFTEPYHVMTVSRGAHRFKNLTYEYVNASAVRISWSGDADNYTVRYSSLLKLPVERWAALTSRGNTVLINGIEPTNHTFVMVSGYSPVAHSPILNVPPQLTYLQSKDIKYAYTSNGVRVSWRGEGLRVILFTQNITQPLDTWRAVNVTDSNVELDELDPQLPIFVIVSAAGVGARSQVLNIPPRPADAYGYQLGIGLGVGFCILCVLTAIFICIWRKRKMARNRSPSRSQRPGATRGAAPEESEMRVVGGASAVSGANAAGAHARHNGLEPLLNGHVHIIDNPASKTPNGKIKKGRRYDPSDAFDLSRQEPDTTMETTLESTRYSLLDTSRPPDLDFSRTSRDLSANNSFNKLPDDNMNSELTRSTEFQLDNSKIQPTLQPNG
ncbi:unnamed protein product [Leptosia nina]|uniref:Fibronectin type-III domain-containing protein n=1 Tax=Leptosia nina TaxID=320188 RepID=A0AAV1J3X7_9NEOP